MEPMGRQQEDETEIKGKTIIFEGSKRILAEAKMMRAEMTTKEKGNRPDDGRSVTAWNKGREYL